MLAALSRRLPGTLDGCCRRLLDGRPVLVDWEGSKTRPVMR